MKLKSLSIIAISLALGACAGSSYGPEDVGKRAIRADNKPYIGEKPFGMDKITFTKSFYHYQPEAWTLGNFFGDGSKAAFVAINRVAMVHHKSFISVNDMLSDPQYKSVFQFSKIDKDGVSTSQLELPGCLFPRGAAAADFNKSGIDGVIVGCHGFDRHDGFYPGEMMKLVLPDGKGGFTVSDVGPSGFNHSVAAGDVNGDGYPDIVVGDPKHLPAVYFLINQKDGTFKPDNSRISGLVSNSYYAVKLVDVDGDGIIDLVVGGEEFSRSPTAVLFGDKDGNFGKDRITIPAVPDRGIVLDFIPVTNNGERVLYVNRTASPSSKDGYYRSITLQSVNLTTGISKVEFDETRSITSADYWVPWWFPTKQNGQVGVTTYTSSDNPPFITNVAGASRLDNR